MEKLDSFVESVYEDLELVLSRPVYEKKKRVNYEETVGIDRIVEIIQCNMWPGMKKVSSNARGMRAVRTF